MPILITTVSIGAIGALLIWTLFARVRTWYRLRHIPGPPAVAWSKLWLARWQAGGKLLTHFRETSKRYGPIARIGPDWILVSSPSEIRRIWSVRSGYRRSSWETRYAGFRIDPNSDSILTMVDNKSHLRVRSKLLPAYQGKGITGQEAVIDGQITRFISLLERKYVSTARGDRPVPFEMGRGFSYFTQDAISAVGFGAPFGYLDEDADFYGALDAMEGMLLPCALMGLLPPLLWAVTSPLSKPFLPRKTDPSGVGRLLGVIDERVRTRYGDHKVRNADVVQVLVDSGMPRGEVEAEALVHLLAGTDTTAGALRNAVFLLSTSPAAYRRLQAEIDAAVAGGPGRVGVTRPVIADAEAREMAFLQACIKESMRYWPPVLGMQGKTSDADDVICGVRVPAGTHVAWGLFEALRDKDVFGNDADFFEPMRWLDTEPEKLKEMEATQGLVFAAGTKWECLGKRLANIEMEKVLFELFLRFDFAMLNPIEPFQWRNLNFTVHDNMNVIITRRGSPGGC
ncbi:cytochrome P450 family protein [Parathielavia hyrcaniae]|uniref:Cytochrome P450 family protein n=1 Tax=Parathielavia hyrcaniae TaxID=113614 RepID=A0AAN6PU35_9PEZI|nr:cytochrome P450 family protein [Parathielavia hyrcaniae]